MKTTKMFLLLVLCLLLTACGSQGEPAAASSEGEFDLSQFSREELTAAHTAAHEYYRDAGVRRTILRATAPRTGEISFYVSSYEEEVITALNTVVSLERQEGVWTVIGEEECRPESACESQEEPAAASSQEEFDLSQFPGEELVAAHTAGQKYYSDAGVQGAVLRSTAPRTGEISFYVSSSEEGVITDLHIVVSLERQEGVWTVIREEEECWPEFMS